MSGINIILIALGLFGMLPLTFILYGWRRVQKILDKGMMAKARVYQVYSSIRLGSVVSYTFYNEHRQQFYGRLHCKLGLYKVNDVIDIYYLKKIQYAMRLRVPGNLHCSLLFSVFLIIPIFGSR